MNPTRTSTIRLVKIGSFVIVAGLIISFAIWRSLNYARGPEILIHYPENGSSTASSTVEIIGQTVRATNLLLNGDAVSVDQSGSFKESIIIFPGMNIVTLTATDQFGRSALKKISVVGTSQFPEVNHPVSSSPSTSTSSVPTSPTSTAR